MTGTKFGMAYKEYRDINKGIIEWIIGLTIAELGLIISQKLYMLNWILYLFVLVSFFSILLAVLIMYVIVSSVDAELHSALLAINTEERMTEKDFGTKFEERLGSFNKLLINLIIDKKTYKYLFVFFAFNTVVMIVLIISNIHNIK